MLWTEFEFEDGIDADNENLKEKVYLISSGEE